MQEIFVHGAEGGNEHAAASIIGFWTSGIKLLVLGYAYAYFGTASTAIYFLLRHDVDATETDEVFRDADKSEEKFGLPALTKDEQGAPEVKAEATAVGASPEGPAEKV